MVEYGLLFVASIFAGVINSVAGGGSFFTFPMLLFTGMNPIIANATSTMATWPGMVASTVAYRPEIAANRQKLPALMIISLIGSIIGTIVLLKTPEQTFAGLVPYLLLFATLLFAFGNSIAQKLRKMRGDKKPSTLSHAGVFCLQMGIAIYGGYFGGGMGIVLLSMFALMGLTHIHEMNALKAVLTSTINGVAVVIFIAAHVIAWPQAIVMLCGSVLGGYSGASYAKRLPPLLVRHFIIATGVVLTIYFFLKR